MKENKVQSKYEQMRDLVNQIESLHKFINRRESKSERNYFVVKLAHKYLYKIGWNWSWKEYVVPEILQIEIFEIAKKKLAQLQKEFDELNQF